MGDTESRVFIKTLPRKIEILRSIMYTKKKMKFVFIVCWFLYRCPTSDWLIPPFYQVSEVGNVAITGIFKAFKFSGFSTIYFRCNVEYCHNRHDKRCSQVGESSSFSLSLTHLSIIQCNASCHSIRKKKIRQIYYFLNVLTQKKYLNEYDVAVDICNA